MELLEELGITVELLCEEGALFRTELELLAAVDPVEVLEYCPRILTCALLRIY